MADAKEITRKYLASKGYSSFEDVEGIESAIMARDKRGTSVLVRCCEGDWSARKWPYEKRARKLLGDGTRFDIVAIRAATGGKAFIRHYVSAEACLA